MALEDKIHVVKPSGEAASPPKSLDELRMYYFHGADLFAKPSTLGSSMEDLNRLITIRPNTTLRMGGNSGNPLLYRGIFAYGVNKGKNVKFEIYTPRQNQKKGSISQVLRDATAALSLALLESGYTLTKVEYK